MEGHVYGFARLGRVPVDKIRYDNLNSAVKQVLFGRSAGRIMHPQPFRGMFALPAHHPARTSPQAVAD